MAEASSGGSENLMSTVAHSATRYSAALTHRKQALPSGRFYMPHCAESSGELVRSLDDGGGRLSCHVTGGVT